MSLKEIRSPFLKGLSENNEDIPSFLELPMNDFIEIVEKHLINSQPKKEEKWNLDEYPLLPGQAIYVMSYPNEVTISYQKGLQDLLGYSTEEFTMDLLLNYFHPDQYEMIQRIIKGAINYGITQHTNNGPDTWLYLIFKARKKDGTYIPLLRQTSIYERDSNGRMISSFSILSDLTGMNSAEKVEWKLKGPHVDEEKFRQFIYKAFSELFTAREQSLLKLLDEGKNSQQIAKALSISKNTVDTHRRNMRMKARSTNTTELLDFSRKNGLI